MLKEYRTPDEFLEHLQESFSCPFQTAPHEEFKSVVLEGLSESKVDLPYPEADLYNFKPIVEELREMVLRHAAPGVVRSIREEIAIGSLNTGEANAAIYRSPDKKHAIVLNYGLFLLLGKLSKLFIALNEPESLAYCNRKPAESVTREDIYAYIFELIEYYQLHGVPRGAMVYLKPNANRARTFFLVICELFILCHELGHFLNGDLDHEENFSATSFDWTIFKDNANHVIEYAADLRAFELLASVVQKELGFEPRIALLYLTFLFDTLYLLGCRDSISHPDPLKRVINIAEHFFGPDTSSLMQASYEDSSLLFLLFAKRDEELRIREASNERPDLRSAQQPHTKCRNVSVVRPTLMRPTVVKE